MSFCTYIIGVDSRAALKHTPSRVHFLLLFLSLSFSILSWSLSAPEKFKSDRSEVELLSSLDSIDAKTNTLYLAVSYKFAPEWHIYWKNSGDSGTPPTFEWESNQANVEFSDILWPAPKRIPLEPLMSYGYEHEVLLPVKLSLKQTLSSDLNIKLRANWLVCKIECVPESQNFEIKIPFSNTSVTSRESESIQKYISRQAEYIPQISASFHKDAEYFNLKVLSKIPALFENLKEVYFYSDEGLRVKHATKQELAENTQDSITLAIARDANDDDTKTTLSGILEIQRNDGTLQYIQLSGESGTAAPFSFNTFALSILFSFLGGLLLNLMPCVFPVLFLKIYALTKNNMLTNTQRKLEAWAYGAGVVSSFLLLAIVLQLLKGAGFAVGWGFQLQSPAFVAAAFLLFVAMGLSLLGLYEVSGSFTGAGQSLTQKSGAKGSFFTGVLATLVATPCSAPFMGSAVGYALTRQSWESFPIFVFLGIGLAFPFVVLAYFPSLLKWIPKPGAWMEHLKQFFGFALLGTALWLLWIFGTQQSSDALISALGAALFLALGLWALRFKNKVLRYSLVALSIFALFSFYKNAVSSSNVKESSSNETQWESFSSEKIDSYLSQNKAVFIDFTASWCLTCQVNKKLVLNTSEADKIFTDNNIVRVRADWTNYDASITQALSKLGRQSVPVYAYYPAGKKDPVILPELLSMDILTTAIINQNKEE